MPDRFERHARNVSLLTVLSRITGLAREAAFSRVFGAGGLTDAFFFAFLIPNLFRRLFGEGALAAAFLPVYSRLERDDPQTARRLASLIVSLLVIVLGAIVLIGELILFAISHRAGHSNLALWLLMVMLPYMPLVCLVAVLGAMLQVHGRFGPTAAAPIVLNLCLIAAIIGLSFVFSGDVNAPDYERARLIHIGCVAGSVVFAGILQVSWTLWALRDHRWWVRERAGARGPLRIVLGQAGPMILGLGVLQLNVLLDGVIAGYPTVIGATIFGLDYPLTEGALAAVTFAQRLYQFPLGVFGIAIATAIFPALARLSDDDRAFADIVRRGLRLVIFIGLPASAGLILVRRPLTAVILQGGDFTVADTARVARVLLGYAPAIWAFSMTHVLTRAFYARGDAMTPVRTGVCIVILNFILNCTLIWTPLREAGLAWSTAICSIIQVVALSILLRRRVGALVDRSVLTSWGKSLVATVLMIACLLAVMALLPEASDDWAGSLLALAVLVITGGIVFALVAFILGMRELRWSLGRSG
ncbi:MAG: murein biosynthesis integral membrane protein MurJ [Planctomycetota bacterium]|nr:murein biosynthesis integral membrane protein MurJ [Planctomycetota bacterium]